MTNRENTELRVWPGIVGATMVASGFSLAVAAPDAAGVGYGAVVAGGLGVMVWWAFFSKARRSERLGVFALMVLAWFGMRPFLHESILGGAMGAMPVLAFPVLGAAVGAWAWATRNSAVGIRRASLVAMLAIAAAFCTTVRTAGIGRGLFELHWRWTPTPEDLLLAQGEEKLTPIAPEPGPPAIPDAPVQAAEATDTVPAVPPPRLVEWPGFRGADRDGVVHNLTIETDWSKSPPQGLWRRPIGPGWSSFAVAGDLIYTQEQRGDEEIVSAYRLSTGKPVWRHRDAVRFYESNGGAGPRATPTLHEGLVYAFGATGILNALDAATGEALWSRNVAIDSKTEVPTWGFSSSPLVVNDLVVVAAAGTLAAYETAAGKLRWVGPPGGGYSSPHKISMGDVTQIVLLGGGGATSLAPADGAVLWRHEWDTGGIVQPALTGDGDLLINSIAATGGAGNRRLAIRRGSDGGWTAEELWTSTGLKPYFNDFVVHDGHAFGFDGSILSCIDLTDGARKWKGGRYGSGQLLLLADQDALLVISDEGELALVSATPDEFREIARFKAIDGKTWNHPVLVRDILLVRNGEEMAAFRLTTTRSGSAQK